MPYSVVESALVSRIVTSTLYSSSFVTTGDFRVLSGGVPRAVIAKFGGHSRRDLTFRIIQDEWVVNLDLYTRFNGELDVLATDMNANRQELIDTIEKWPVLNGSTGVFRAKIRQIGPEQGLDPDNHAQYGMQTVIVSITETFDPGRLEP